MYNFYDFEYVEQRREKDCTSCVTAMITGEDPEDYEEFCENHDFEVYEHCAQDAFLALNGWLTRLGFNDVDEDGFMSGRMHIKNGPAILTVESDVDGYSHCCLWTGSEVYDPQQEADVPTKLEDYEVLKIIPIYREEDV